MPPLNRPPLDFKTQSSPQSFKRGSVINVTLRLVPAITYISYTSYFSSPFYMLLVELTVFFIPFSHFYSLEDCVSHLYYYHVHIFNMDILNFHFSVNIMGWWVIIFSHWSCKNPSTFLHPLSSTSNMLTLFSILISDNTYFLTLCISNWFHWLISPYYFLYLVFFSWDHLVRVHISLEHFDKEDLGLKKFLNNCVRNIVSFTLIPGRWFGQFN